MKIILMKMKMNKMIIIMKVIIIINNNENKEMKWNKVMKIKW